MSRGHPGLPIKTVVLQDLFFAGAWPPSTTVNRRTETYEADVNLQKQDSYAMRLTMPVSGVAFERKSHGRVNFDDECVIAYWWTGALRRMNLWGTSGR